MLLANFGAPAWVFALLLAWLATAGLPATVAVLAVAWSERLPWVGVLPLGAALVTMAVLALAAQLGACRLRRGLAPARARILAMKWSRRRFLGGALALGGGAAAAGVLPSAIRPRRRFRVRWSTSTSTSSACGDCGSDLRLKWALGVPAEVFDRGARLLGA